MQPGPSSLTDLPGTRVCGLILYLFKDENCEKQKQIGLNNWASTLNHLSKAVELQTPVAAMVKKKEKDKDGVEAFLPSGKRA